jgi:hypothetical protein
MMFVHWILLVQVRLEELVVDCALEILVPSLEVSKQQSSPNKERV